jgi:hypothetical protein
MVRPAAFLLCRRVKEECKYAILSLNDDSILARDSERKIFPTSAMIKA